MQQYTQDNPPRRGTARKIWRQFHDMGIVLTELHYNPNCWGKGRAQGYGTWACAINRIKSVRLTIVSNELFCGLNNGAIYLQTLAAPYNAKLVKDLLVDRQE